MIIIYSETEVKGVAGVYCSPRLFDGVIDKRATLVITKDKEISDLYTKAGIEVKGFPRSTVPQQKETVETSSKEVAEGK